MRGNPAASRRGRNWRREWELNPPEPVLQTVALAARPSRRCCAVSLLYPRLAEKSSAEPFFLLKNPTRPRALAEQSTSEVQAPAWHMVCLNLSRFSRFLQSCLNLSRFSRFLQSCLNLSRFSRFLQSCLNLSRFSRFHQSCLNFSRFSPERSRDRIRMRKALRTHHRAGIFRRSILPRRVFPHAPGRFLCFDVRGGPVYCVVQFFKKKTKWP